MRTIRAASAALLTVAAISLTAPVASAATEGGDVTPFGFSVTPSTIAAGGRVTLSVSDCDHTAYASSAVFDRTRIPRGGTGHATVDRDAKRGATYRVTFTCDGRSGTTSLTIAGAGPAPTPLVPSGVRGGLGGSIGSGTPEIAAGAALVLIAASGTVYAARRRTAGRGR
ncbi:hypothetical protein [Streptomyces montanisoli]|uniref:Lipoprotein n=1 Tax=Streptomyces montanisoli TaxID=2798581 RepID=A0A940RX76_9ACTN|nr:hypothetical protein [Streptomyces montanisoli]MBP0460912.1 hypothetical protein [Streptomyces montanisoli]